MTARDELLATIRRVRRGTRVLDVQTICDALERELVASRDTAPATVQSRDMPCPICAARRKADAARQARHRRGRAA